MKPTGAYITLTFAANWILIVTLISSCTRTGLLATNLASSLNIVNEPLKVIVVVPTTEKRGSYCNGSQPEWERGEGFATPKKAYEISKSYVF